ncbi:MAG: hypothetical protein LBE01_02620 [Deltaproteobacteria bacterium]|jgi:hypothetical protein|nr:hypothetical protein [Deltaproteobacteria bacterium]
MTKWEVPLKEREIQKALKPLSIILLLVGLTACLKPVLAPFGGKDAPVLEGESFAEFLDVPYPSVMGLDRQSTFAYDRRGVHSGTFVVVGRMTLDEVGEYFDLHLPAHGWTPLAEAQGPKLVSTWVKEKKVLTIVVSQAFAIAGQDSRVEIWVSPPRYQSDLGQRVVYKKPPEPGKTRSTTPIRRSGGVSEEDI